MAHKIPLMVAAAVAALLLLTAVQAQGPHYLVDVDTTIDAATATDASGTITVCNVSADSPMTIDTVAGKLSYKEGRGVWTEVKGATVNVSGVAPDDVIGAGECKDGLWNATYDPLDGATRIKIEAQVTVEERDKVFIARDCADVE